jgi:hypothetical protein
MPTENPQYLRIDVYMHDVRTNSGLSLFIMAPEKKLADLQEKIKKTCKFHYTKCNQDGKEISKFTYGKIKYQAV